MKVFVPIDYELQEYDKHEKRRILLLDFFHKRLGTSYQFINISEKEFYNVIKFENPSIYIKQLSKYIEINPRHSSGHMTKLNGKYINDHNSFPMSYRKRAPYDTIQYIEIEVNDRANYKRSKMNKIKPILQVNKKVKKIILEEIPIITELYKPTKIEEFEPIVEIEDSQNRFRQKEDEIVRRKYELRYALLEKRTKEGVYERIYQQRKKEWNELHKDDKPNIEDKQEEIELTLEQIFEEMQG